MGIGACCLCIGALICAMNNDADTVFRVTPNFQSDHDFADFITPVTNPVFFEDPRMLTEARFVFANQRIPVALGGDDAQIYGLQMRARVTDNLAFVVNKSGYVVSDSPLVNDGWADTAFGVKVSLLTMPEEQFLMSAGANYELPSGQASALQGNGDGEFNMYVTSGWEVLEDVHWVSATGLRLPVDRDAENQIAYWSNHVDRELMDGTLYLFGECNWFNVLRSAQGTPLPLTGVDFINLGGSGVAGNNVVTTALGVKLKPTNHLEIGLAYEVPVSGDRDILDDRIMFDVILRY
jgi:hypothetical protein